MIETHWICDVCGKRVVEKESVENVNETGIQDWYTVTLNIGRVKDPINRKSTYKFGYSCSDDCVAKVIDYLKEKSLKEHEVEKHDDLPF